jgi:hypothetical protein
MSLLAAWFWPKVSDRKNAQFAITEAWVVAAALAVITALLATAEILGPATDGPGAEAFVTPIFFAGIAFGIYRKSRLAAISALALYLAGRVYALATVGPRIGFINILVALAFLHGVRGALAYHKFPPRPAGLPSLAQSFEALGQNPPQPVNPAANNQEGNSVDS